MLMIIIGFEHLYGLYYH